MSLTDRCGSRANNFKMHELLRRKKKLPEDPRERANREFDKRGESSRRSSFLLHLPQTSTPSCHPLSFFSSQHDHLLTLISSPYPSSLAPSSSFAPPLSSKVLAVLQLSSEGVALRSLLPPDRTGAHTVHLLLQDHSRGPGRRPGTCRN